MAHPADLDYFIGGTLAKWAASGTAIVYVVVTAGEKGGSETMTPADIARLRRTEQQAAARILGVQEVVFLGYSDAEMLTPTLELRGKLVAEIRRFRPDSVVTLDPTRFYVGDTYINHPDHRVVGETTLAAVFPACGNRFCHPELLAQGLQPHHVKQVWLGLPQEPNYWEAIDDFIDQKVQTYAAHASEGVELAELEGRFREQAAVTGEDGSIGYQEAFRVMQIG